MLLQLPSAIHSIENDLLNKQNIKLYIKRDDLIHPDISGNKWRKLVFNIETLRHTKNDTVLTFGGAFSNHIYATAAAGNLLGIKTIGVIRGEKTDPLGTTLQFAEQQGMQLHFISREAYKNKENEASALSEKFGNFYEIPEGGANDLGVKGCENIVTETLQQLDSPPDYWCVACGTGTTLAGIVKAAQPAQRCIGFSALNISDWQKDMQKRLNTEGEEMDKNNWQILSNYHFGGYAKWKPELIHFINAFKKEYDIALDPIYTGKMFYGIFDLLEKGYFERGSTIVAVHTGGLQGIEGYNTLKLKKYGLRID